MESGGLKPPILLKRDSTTCVFLWILLNHWEHVLHRTPPSNCFYSTSKRLSPSKEKGLTSVGAVYLTDTPLCKDECLNFQLKNTVHKRQSKIENAKIVEMIEKSKSIYPIRTGFYFNFSREFPVPKMELKSIMSKKNSICIWFKMLHN